MKAITFVVISLLLILHTGCFGRVGSPKTTPIQSPIEIHMRSTDESSENTNPESSTTSGLKTELDPSALLVSEDLQGILTTHARIRGILNGLLTGKHELNLVLQTEFNALLDRAGQYDSAMKLQHFKESLIGNLTTYKLVFYEDSLASLQSGSYVRSEQRVQYEAYLLNLGGIDEKKLEENNALIHRIAAKLPIPYNEGQGIVIDESIIGVLMANQKKVNQKIDEIFDRYLIEAEAPTLTEEIPGPAVASDDVASRISAFFTLGSTAEEVEHVMGKPSWIQNYKYEDDEWQYGKSYVRFDADYKVNAYNNADKNLKVHVYTIIPDTPRIIKGYTQQQVGEAIGTPHAVHYFNKSGSSWYYGQSRIDFDKEGIVKGWINSTDFNLFK